MESVSCRARFEDSRPEKKKTVRKKIKKTRTTFYRKASRLVRGVHKHYGGGFIVFIFFFLGDVVSRRAFLLDGIEAKPKGFNIWKF